MFRPGYQAGRPLRVQLHQHTGPGRRRSCPQSRLGHNVRADGHLPHEHQRVRHPPGGIKMNRDVFGYHHIGESNGGCLGSGTFDFTTYFKALTPRRLHRWLHLEILLAGRSRQRHHRPVQPCGASHRRDGVAAARLALWFPSVAREVGLGWSSMTGDGSSRVSC